MLDAENVTAMQASGKVVWLSATAETIQKRMLQDKNTGDFRPALTDKGRMAEIEDMLLKRNPYYDSACDFSIHTDNVPVNEISAIIIQRIKDKVGD